MTQGFLSKLLNRQQVPTIIPIQMGEDGKEDIAASLALQNQTQPLTLKERLLGRELVRDVDTPTAPDENGQATVETQRYTNYRPGLLNDLSSGYNENYATGFAAPNFGQQQTADGRQKGFGYRLGEGLGTVGRFVDSPLGRGLIAAGLNKALGYDNSLQEGLTAAVGRQNAQTADKVYRQQLSQMGYSDDDLAQIKGNITSDIYKNLAQNVYRFRNLDQNSYVKMKTLYDRQLQQGIITPEEYKMNVDALNNQYVNSQIQTMQAGNVQESNQTRNTNMNEQLLPYKQYALQMSPQIAMGNLGVAQGNLALGNAKFQHQLEQDIERANSGNEGERVLAQLDELKNLYDQLPQNKAAKGTQKAVAAAAGASSQFGLRSDEVAAFEGVSNMVTNLVARKLAGEKGVMTDKDFERAKKMVPSVYDSPQQAQAKMNAIKQLYYAPQQSTSNKTNGLDVNMDAIDAELARRGIK